MLLIHSEFVLTGLSVVSRRTWQDVAVGLLSNPTVLIKRQAIFESINKHTNAAGIRLYAHLGAEVCGKLVTDILKNRAAASRKVRAKISGIQPRRGRPAE